MGTVINGRNAAIVANGTAIELIESAVPFSEMHPIAAQKDPLPDAPDTVSMGCADAPGSILTGTATNNTSVSESVMVDFVIPETYQLSGPVSVIVRCLVTANRDTAQTVAAACSRWQEDGTLSGDIVTTGAQTITTAYADYSFVINPAAVVPGDLLYVGVFFAADDSAGGSGAGTITCSQITMETGIRI